MRLLAISAQNGWTRMPERIKPRHRGGYRREETKQVEATCLTVAVTLGAFMDRLCIVGGLAPTLIVDHRLDAEHTDVEAHVGTNDLDVGLSIALLDDSQYAEISHRLRQEGFKPDVNDKGNPTPQRWKLGDLKVTVDFLLPTLPGAEQGGRVHPLEGDFGALIAPGLEMAFDERENVTLAGDTLKGERVSRTIPVCGPAAFVVLKALAFADRAEPKDAYDLLYILRRWPDGVEDIAARLAKRDAAHRVVTARALSALSNDFASPESIGPRRAAEFDGLAGDDLDAATADAFGLVDDLLRGCTQRGLWTK